MEQSRDKFSASMRRRTAVPFYVRPDTTDVAVINDIFVKGGYDLRRRDRTTKQRRHADVAAFLNANNSEPERGR